MSYLYLRGKNATACIIVEKRYVDPFLRALAGDESANLFAGVG